MGKKKEDPKQWIPPSELPDAKCSLLQFWSRFHDEIAEFRSFRKPEKTISSYTATLKVIEASASQKAIGVLTPYEIWDLVISVPYRMSRKGKQIFYSKSTLITRLAIIHDMYLFAESRGICPDILKYPPWKFLDENNLDFALTTALIKLQIQEKLKKSKILPRYLLLPQEQKLAREILKHIKDDGRWVGLAILLYSGPRISVARSVAFKDFKSFNGHPERRYIRYYHSTDDNGDFQEYMKTRSSPRDTPEHIELKHIMEIREDFVRTSLGVDDIGELPAVCFRNEFTRRCTAFEFSEFAKEQIMRLFDDEYWDIFLMLHYIDFEDFGIEGDSTDNLESIKEDAELSARMLRRNEFTKNYAETRLTDNDSRLCMGHKIKDANSIDKTPYSENELWVRLLAMDHRMILPELHPGWYTEISTDLPPKSVPDAGIHYMYISPELLSQGTCCLELDLVLNASGDDLILELYRQLPEGCEIQVKTIYKESSPHELTKRLNPDYSHWPLTWNSAQKLCSTGKSNDNAINTDKSDDVNTDG